MCDCNRVDVKTRIDGCVLPWRRPFNCVAASTIALHTHASWRHIPPSVACGDVLVFLWISAFFRFCAFYGSAAMCSARRVPRKPSATRVVSDRLLVKVKSRALPAAGRCRGFRRLAEIPWCLAAAAAVDCVHTLYCIRSKRELMTQTTCCRKIACRFVLEDVADSVLESLQLQLMRRVCGVPLFQGSSISV